jgi:hypothetical protein
LGLAFESLAEIQIVFPSEDSGPKVSGDTASTARTSLTGLKSEGVRVIGLDGIDRELMKPLFVLQHSQDAGLLPDHMAVSRTVFFSGGGGRKCPASARERIWREVTAERGILTPEEALELIEFFSLQEETQVERYGLPFYVEAWIHQFRQHW